MSQLLSLADVERITGHDFKVIKRRIGGLEPVKKEGVKHLYDAPTILELIYTDKDVEELDLTKERAKLTQEQRKKTNIERRLLEGSVMEIDDVVAMISNVAINLKAKLLAIPAKAAPELVNLDKPSEAQKVLKTYIYETLTEVSSEQFSNDLADKIERYSERLKSL